MLVQTLRFLLLLFWLEVLVSYHIISYGMSNAPLAEAQRVLGFVPVGSLGGCTTCQTRCPECFFNGVNRVFVGPRAFVSTLHDKMIAGFTSRSRM